jgi:hypothetical protein
MECTGNYGVLTWRLWGGVEVDGERVSIYGLIYDLTQDGTSHPKPEFVLEGVASDVESITDPHTKAATMLRRLISAYVFEDGKKRTAWAIARRILRRDGFILLWRMRGLMQSCGIGPDTTRTR